MLYEEKFYESLDVDALASEFSMSRQELEVICTPLLASGWIEKDAETLGGYGLRLTHLGKEQIDLQTGNGENERIRELILEALSAEYEKNVNAIVDSEWLMPKLGLGWNKGAFNLEILRMQGCVQLNGRIGAGHPSYTISLTPFGKTLHDNPPPKVLFLSHAASDEEIAKYLKRAIENIFPRVDVFVSSDPEDLPPGDPWVQTIVQKLASSRMVIVLATDRGLSRKWVWFEAGAGWASQNNILSCCLGKQRKGELLAPFSFYQGINIDEEKDCSSLLAMLEGQFGKPVEQPDCSMIVSDLTRLDARAEVRAEELMQRQKASPYSETIKAEVENGLQQLDEADKEALKQLIMAGEMTDAQAIHLLKQKGVLRENLVHIFTRIYSRTPFVQRIWPHHEDERLTGYTGPWKINPSYRAILEGYLFPRPQS